MGFNNNVDGTDSQFYPEVKDYFEYYPYMRKKVTEEQVQDMIAGPQTILKDGKYVNKHIHPSVLDASARLQVAFRHTCDAEWESLDGQNMMNHYMHLLHGAICWVYLGEKVTRPMVSVP